MNTQQLFSFSFFSFPQDIWSIPTEGWQGWAGVTKTSVEESGLSHEGKSIRTLRWPVNIYSFSLTTIEFPWRALTVQRERSELMAIVLLSSRCIICLIQWGTLHQTRENPAAYWWIRFVWGLKKKMRRGRGWVLAEGRMGGRMVFGGGDVTDVQFFERKLNKYLIS